MYSAVYWFVRFRVSLWLLPRIRATLHAAYDEQQDAPGLRPGRDHARGVLGLPSLRFQPTLLYAKGRCARHVGLLLALHAWLTARTVATTPRRRSAPCGLARVMHFLDGMVAMGTGGLLLMLLSQGQMRASRTVSYTHLTLPTKA